MTFEEYQAECCKRQSDYISKEQHRMAAARKLWRKYQAAMYELGLHALTADELIARDSELTKMKAALPEKFSDSLQMRALYDLQVSSAAKD